MILNKALETNKEDLTRLNQEIEVRVHLYFLSIVTKFFQNQTFIMRRHGER